MLDVYVLYARDINENLQYIFIFSDLYDKIIKAVYGRSEVDNVR